MKSPEGGGGRLGAVTRGARLRGFFLDASSGLSRTIALHTGQRVLYPRWVSSKRRIVPQRHLPCRAIGGRPGGVFFYYTRAAGAINDKADPRPAQQAAAAPPRRPRPAARRRAGRSP